MKIYVVGLGPGGPEQMTNRAQEALRKSDILVGYTLYIDLIKDQFPDKKFIATPMKKEVDRCRTAVEKALEGATVAVVSSGDAGVYGMAGIVLELAEPYPFLEVEVIPGITAACSGSPGRLCHCTIQPIEYQKARLFEKGLRYCDAPSGC